jgi:hypothetical protein
VARRAGSAARTRRRPTAPSVSKGSRAVPTACASHGPTHRSSWRAGCSRPARWTRAWRCRRTGPAARSRAVSSTAPGARSAPRSSGSGWRGGRCRAGRARRA